MADTKAGFNVGSGFTNYEHTFDLPAGTYFVRTEFNNDVPAANRQLTIRNLNITGRHDRQQHIERSTNNANALATADSYIRELSQRGRRERLVRRRRRARRSTSKLIRHAFNFGTAVPNVFTDTYLVDNPPPGSNAANFQQMLV